MTTRQIELLEEIRDCQGMVDRDEFDEADRAELEGLIAENLVALSYRLTGLGKQKLERYGV